MSEVPSAVSESTAVEIVRLEGSAKSWKAIGTIVAGDILAITSTSGAILAAGSAVGGSQNVGVALSQATSGNRVVTIKGYVRAIWDGTGTLNFGTPIGISTTQSGYFEPSATTSGAAVIGYCVGTGPGFAGAAANSGALVAVRIGV